MRTHKKRWLFLLIASVITAAIFFIVIPDNPCEVCDPNQDHHFSASESVPLIAVFNTRFNITTYGGTIFGVKDYFEKGFDSKHLPQGGSRAFKFHFCSPKSGASDFFLVFQNAYCINNRLMDFENVVPFYFTGGDLTFPKTRCNSSSSVDCVQRDGESRPYPDATRPLSDWQKSQEFNGIDLPAVRAAFKLKTIFTRELQKCTDNYVGYFIYNTSLLDIFGNKDKPGDPPCQGIRYYYAYDRVKSTYKIRIILVGVDANGRNLNTWRETSVPFN